MGRIRVKNKSSPKHNVKKKNFKNSVNDLRNLSYIHKPTAYDDSRNRNVLGRYDKYPSDANRPVQSAKKANVPVSIRPDIKEGSQTIDKQTGIIYSRSAREYQPHDPNIQWDIEFNNRMYPKLPQGPKGGTIPKDNWAQPGHDHQVTGCCSTYVVTANNVKRNSCLVLLLHLSLFIVVALYIVLGASIFMKIDDSLGQDAGQFIVNDMSRDSMLRRTTAEKLLNVSLEAVLEDSRDAILDTIFMSDKLQAALAIFKTSRMAVLPADHQLQILSGRVLATWKYRMEDLLKTFQEISVLEYSGFELTPKQLTHYWGDDQSNLQGVLAWDFWSSCLHGFLLMTTIGSPVRSHSKGGQAMTVCYVILGFPLYWWTVITWSKRLHKFMQFSRSIFKKRLKMGAPKNSRGVSPSWSHQSAEVQKTSNLKRDLLVFLLSMFLAFGCVIGIGPLACSGETFESQVETSFLSLFLVRHPTPLPKGGPQSCLFFCYILMGHISTISFVFCSKDFIYKQAKRLLYSNQN